MLDSYFNFTKKSDLVGNLQYDFLKNWWWLTFFGATLYIHFCYTWHCDETRNITSESINH